MIHWCLDQPVRATLLKGSDSPISHQLSTTPQLGAGLDRPFQLYVQLLSGLIFRRYLAKANTAAVSSSMFQSGPPWPLTLIVLSPSPMVGRGRSIDVLFVAQSCIDTQLLHFDRLWVSALTTVYCTKKLLRWGLRATLIDRNRILESSLIKCSFNKPSRLNPGGCECLRHS